MASVWAHRGASAYAPENTMEAFRLAEKMGADGFELDVHLSLDGELVVTHDENVRRVTGGVDRMIRDMTLQEIQALDVSCGKEGYQGARIPTLEEVLTYLKTNALFLNIEIKSGVVLYEGIEKKTVEMVRAFGLADRVIYSSFNHHSLLLARQADPDAKIGLLYSEGMVDPHLYAQHLHADAIHPHEFALLIPGAAEGCARAGIQMNPWTVDDPDHMRKMLSLGCNALITNVPDIARAVVDAQG
jgi:glycerophosphoryl diester phosphodiesterase